MTLDNIIVLSYLIFILILGIYKRANIVSFKNYARVEDTGISSKLILVATIFASSVGGVTTFGIAEKAFSGDISYTYGLILAIPIDLLIAIYLVPKIVKHYGAESVGDILFKYYGKTGRLIAGITSVIVCAGFMAAQICVSGYIFQYFLKINHIEGVILSYGIVLIYTTIGGLQSIIFTNIVQFFAMIIAIPIITIVGLYKIGASKFFHELPPEKIYFIHNHMLSSDLITNTIAAMLGFYVMNLYPTFIQRTLINNDPHKTTSAIYIKSTIYFIFLVLVTINGLIAFNLYPTEPSNLALPYLIDQIIPTGLQGIVVIGLLASVMSTADSDLNVTSISLVKDILQPIFKINNQKKLLLIARGANVLIGYLAIVGALAFNNVIDLVIFITGFWGPIILVPMVFAFFNIIIDRRIMILCGLTGAISFLSWEYFVGSTFKLKGVFIGTMASLIIFCLGLLAKHKQDKNFPAS